jgi:hypothetical protein
MHPETVRRRLGLLAPAPETPHVNPAMYSALTGRSPFAVRQLILSGELATVHVGGRLLVRLPRLGRAFPGG